MIRALRRGQLVRHETTGFIGRVVRNKLPDRQGRRATLVREVDLENVIVHGRNPPGYQGQDQWLWDHELELIQIRRLT
jgi:hypothetical protein